MAAVVLRGEVIAVDLETVSGDGRLIALKIDKDAVDPEDVEMLGDLVTAAVNEGLRRAGELAGQAAAGQGGEDFDPMAALESLGLGGPGGLGSLGAPGDALGGAQMNRAQRRAAQRKGK